jgi:hypothetical protein
MIRKSLACGTAVLTALLAGCGSATDSREANALHAPEKLDACALFPFDEAQALAGTAIAPLSSTYEDAVGRRELKQCAYNAGTIEHPLLVSLEVRPAQSVRAAERRQESSRAFLGTLSKGHVQDVPGVGEAALWAGGGIDQLHCRQGAVQLVVTMQSGQEPLAAAKKVAQRTFARLHEMQQQQPANQ